MSQSRPSAVRLLVVEDEMIVAQDICEQLRQLGYNVLGPAGDGETALRLSETGHPDMVLMDIALRGRLDGVKTAAIIRERFRLPVIFVTALSDKGTLQRAKATEPFGILYKPFEQHELFAAIETALYKSRLDRALRESEAKYRRTAEDLRRLAAHLEKAREEERTRIAHELHDELGQAMTAMRIDIAWIQKNIPSSAPRLRSRIESLGALADEALANVRRLSMEMRPSILDDLGLQAALEWQVSDFAQRTGIAARLEDGLNDAHLTPEQATALFRIVQEALTNISRHAQATRVRVLLREKDGQGFCRIIDNGLGITDQAMAKRRSFGVVGMRQRVLALGGGFDIAGRPGRGTEIRISIPLRPETP